MPSRVSTLPRIADDLDAEAERVDLRGAARRTGADARALRQLAEGEAVAGDQHVARVLAQRDGGQRQPRVGRGGQVLERVDGEVDLAGGDRLAQRGDEHALAADRDERRVAAVALGGDRDELDVDAVQLAQPGGDELGLGGGERAGAGADAHGRHCVLTPDPGDGLDGGLVEREQVGEGVGVGEAGRTVDELLDAHGGRVDELVGDALQRAAHLLDLVGAEGGHAGG